MGRECKKFYSRLSEIVGEKKGQQYSTVAPWIRRKICFSLVNSIGLCLRGSRTVFNNQAIVSSIQEDAMISEKISSIR